MKKLHENILKVLRSGESLTVPEIAFAVLGYQDVVQPALHELDDQGLVTMRNGFYKASATGIASLNKTN